MDTNDLLRFGLHTLGRLAISPQEVRDIVDTGPGRVEAFNLCDGSRNQREIATAAGIDPGNLSRAITRWREHGVIFVMGSDKSATYLHIYPLPPAEADRANAKVGQRKGGSKKRRSTSKERG